MQLYAMWGRDFPLNFVHWDAVHYLYLAQHGYPAHFDPRDAFFPGYPGLIHLGMLVIHDPVKAALAVSIGSSVVACWFVVQLARHEFDGGADASLAGWLLVLWPGAFFMFAPYSEAPFVAAAAASLYLMRRGRFGWAAVAAAIASVIRPVGLGLAVALLVEIIRQRGWRSLPLIAVVPLPVLGYFAYLGIHTGDFMGYVHAEASPSFGIHLAWPWV
ncbi:MAG: mannosyltransferase family protein, partial [Candidatus Dormibacteraceae bacterium]